METQPKRRGIPQRIMFLCHAWGAAHLFANVEYEVDELRREARLVRLGPEQGVAVNMLPDTCVIELIKPGKLCNGAGEQFAVYSPCF